MYKTKYLTILVVTTGTVEHSIGFVCRGWHWVSELEKSKSTPGVCDYIFQNCRPSWGWISLEFYPELAERIYDVQLDVEHQ